jgi:hypothetical protein
MQPETSESLSRPRYPWGLKLVTGLMGEGKSAYVVQHIICAELIKTDRAVYTNMHIFPDKLEAYLKAIGYRVDMTRLKTLEEDDVKRFWEIIKEPALIVLDEVAEDFGSDAWKEIGPEAGSWARQHRKLYQQCYMVCQHPDHVFKKFRDLFEGRIDVANLRKRWGLPFFLAKEFRKDNPNRSYQSKIYRQSAEIWGLYDTDSLHGKKAADLAKACKHKRTVKEGTTKKGFLMGVGAFFGRRVYLFCFLGVCVAFFGVLFALPRWVLSSTKRGEIESFTYDDRKEAVTGVSSLDAVAFGRIPGERKQSYAIGRSGRATKRGPNSDPH